MLHEINVENFTSRGKDCERKTWSNYTIFNGIGASQHVMFQADVNIARKVAKYAKYNSDIAIKIEQYTDSDNNVAYTLAFKRPQQNFKSNSFEEEIGFEYQNARFFSEKLKKLEIPFSIEQYMDAIYYELSF